MDTVARAIKKSLDREADALGAPYRFDRLRHFVGPADDHGIGMPDGVVRLLEHARNTHASGLSIVRWAYANVHEMECRADDDCDHCVLVGLLKSWAEDALGETR